eukprot:892200-Prorocentrum_minimum.AAC.3
MWSVNVRHAFVPMRGMEHSCRCKLRGSFNSKTSAKHAEKHQAKKPPEVGTPGIFHARGHGASGQQEYSLRAANGQADAGNIPRARPTDKQTPGIFRARGQRTSRRREYSARAANGRADAGNIPCARPTGERLHLGGVLLGGAAHEGKAGEGHDAVHQRVARDGVVVVLVHGAGKVQAAREDGHNLMGKTGKRALARSKVNRRGGWR